MKPMLEPTTSTGTVEPVLCDTPLCATSILESLLQLVSALAPAALSPAGWPSPARAAAESIVNALAIINERSIVTSMQGSGPCVFLKPRLWFLIATGPLRGMWHFAQSGSDRGSCQRMEAGVSTNGN